MIDPKGLLKSSIESTKFPYRKPLRCTNHFHSTKDQQEYFQNFVQKEGKTEVEQVRDFMRD